LDILSRIEANLSEGNDADIQEDFRLYVKSRKQQKLAADAETQLQEPSRGNGEWLQKNLKSLTLY
jgi:hypothetical protein